MTRLLDFLRCVGVGLLLVALAPVVALLLLVSQPEDEEDTYHHQL